MGIETIFIVLGLIVVIALVVFARKSKRKIEEHVEPPESGPR